MKALYTVLLLIASNLFMTFAWYGHLKFKDMKVFQNYGLTAVILISWAIALFEYCFQVPANRIGYKANGGPFTLVQLKVIQEVLSITVFVVFSRTLFRNEIFSYREILAFLLIIIAVYLVFTDPA